ncbi:MAG: dihydrodipicolinate synthase family protein [Desulfobacterales bacterium]|nr:dihydrodipicolinate synthase family protein [Desulfobacterales bacterium]
MKDVIIPPIPTPFISETVSHEKLRDNLRMLIHAGVSGVLALGSNGESVFLSEHEKCQVIETVRDSVPADKIIVAGTGCESTKKTIELTNRVAGLGTDYALIGPPHYFKSAMTTDALSDHYTDIADSVEIPIIPYNSPGFTGLNLGPDLIGRIAEHPNIPGVKDGTGNIAQLADFRRVGGADFIIFTGNAPSFLAALFVGINGGMMPITNCFPEQWMKLIDLFRNNHLEEARTLETLLLKMTGVIMKFGPIGIKAAMDMLGYFGGEPMRPLKPPVPAACKDIQAALETFKKNLLYST